jgi:hypothetical protein
MSTINQTVELYQNNGALLGLGPNQVLSYTDLQDGQTGQISVNDSNNDIEWDFGETASFAGSPATLLATGTAMIGVTVDLPFPLTDITVSLSSPVRVAVLSINGEQVLRFYNADGTEADPAQLLNGLATNLVAALGPVSSLPLVQAILGDPLAFVESNALLTFDLSNADGVALVPCFTLGTLILTPSGEVPVEHLVVLTVDAGVQRLRWIGTRRLDVAELARAPHLQPIRIGAGSLGRNLPGRDLVVSPQHRCLVRSRIVERMAGGTEVLVAAKHLLGLPGVSVVPPDEPVTYIHLLFDRHELIWSNGTVTESFYLGDQAVAAVDAAAREEILALFPDLAEVRPQGARPFVKGRIARKLVERSQANCKPMVEAAVR